MTGVLVGSEVEGWVAAEPDVLLGSVPPPYQVRGRLFDCVGRRAARAPSHSAQDERIE